MGWNEDYSVYKHTYLDGLLLLDGNVCFSDRDLRNVYIPTLQLMKVHEDHPIKLTYGGRISLKPEGDERLIMQICKDPDQNLYDGISILFCPPSYDFPEGKQKLVAKQGFEFSDNTKGDLTVGYAEGRELPLGCEGINTVVQILPPIVYSYIVNFLGSKPTIFYSERYSESGFKPLGRINLEKDLLGVSDVTTEMIKKLEDRFKMPLLKK
ncbi:hypothetical protein J4230_01095 [Candidatus Woesearchaeota archaeon]|nr:hypothetical protein [Candidatus Woesearchaeota archaeon]